MKLVRFMSFEDYKKVCEDFDIQIIDECPVCHKKIHLSVGHYSISDNEENVMILLECPNVECGEIFVANYKRLYSSSNYIHKKGVYPYTAQIDISEEIKEISSSFYQIYSQATMEREQGLSEICGVGYRKALEFLVKDYCIINNDNENEEEIKSMNLMNVINKYIDYSEIKDMASRAVWIGNDETHYTRLWDDKDVNDLLELIDLTCSWIVLKEKTNKYKKEMEKGKKK